MDRKLNDYIDERKEALISDLATLVNIKSVREPAKPGKPFGEGPAAALSVAAGLLLGHGYAPVNHENYAVEADLGPDPALMLLAHLDVVEAGDGWTRPPFSLTREGDMLYGRGVTDDKGPALACLYAMDACRAVLGQPKTGVRLVLGSGEETGSEDMEHYFSKRPTLPYTLSPDADYPLINLEKGRFAPFFEREAENAGHAKVLFIKGGGTQNIVPAKARAAVRGVEFAALQAAALRTQAQTGVRFTLTREPDGSFDIAAAGESAHTAPLSAALRASWFTAFSCSSTAVACFAPRASQ